MCVYMCVFNIARDKMNMTEKMFNVITIRAGKTVMLPNYHSQNKNKNKRKFAII